MLPRDTRNSDMTPTVVDRTPVSRVRSRAHVVSHRAAPSPIRHATMPDTTGTAIPYHHATATLASRFCSVLDSNGTMISGARSDSASCCSRATLCPVSALLLHSLVDG